MTSLIPVFASGYGKNADVFSVGVVGYAMCVRLHPSSHASHGLANVKPFSLRLCGSSPWDAREPWDLVQETVRMREVNFQNRRFDKVSEQGVFTCFA